LRVPDQPASAELDASTADVLVVEDDTDSRESLLELVQQMGFVAVAAADGVEALSLARERAPRLILLDLKMPVMNGWQFLDRRRLDPLLSRIPVVIVSSEGADMVGRDDVQGRLGKPFVESTLLATLQGFLSRPAPREATILVVEDDDDTRTEISELLEEQGYRVVSANNGGEAESVLRSQARPQCIVLDLWMPLMDGWTFASRLKRLGGPPIPTVVITAAGPHWGYPVPPAQVMRKPLDTGAFLAVVKKALATSASSRSSYRA
jgi:CheY-like chemotaxis protein